MWENHRGTLSEKFHTDAEKSLNKAFSCKRCGVVYRRFAARVVICDVIFHSNYSICCINITISSFISSRYCQ